jgi:hypothetical protein
MKIEGTVTAYAQNAYMAGSAQETTAANSAPAAPAVAAAVSPPVSSTSVSLSGKALMLSRLFGTSDPNATLPVLDGAHGMDRGNSGIQATNYLTENDRSLVADMYSYAQQQGADLQYVDHLAITLSRYRQSDNGRLSGGFNSFDAEGHQLSSSYSPADTATAERILNDNTINSTQLDHGFLRYILDPSQALGNTNNISFMEQMVTKFSDQGTSGTQLPPKFLSFSVQDMAMKNVVITASKEVVYKPPESQIVTIDGQWYVLDPSVMKDLDPAQRLSAQHNQPIVDSLLASQATSKESLSARLLDLLDANGNHGGKKAQQT